MKLKPWLLIPLFILASILSICLAGLLIAIVVLIVVALQGGTITWLPAWVSAALPSPAEKNEFIGSLGVLATILFTILGGVGWFLKSAWGLLAKKEPEIKDAPLQKITLDEFSQRYGKYWSKVNWIDRGAVSTGDLRAHGLIVITGRMKLGKTREAFELIQHAIHDNQVAENRLFEPSPTFRFFNREKLQEALRGVDPRAPILLFLDDFPRHYFGEALERLSDLLLALKSCQSVLVVATARLDQMTDEHRTWLTNRKFHEVKLPDMTADQTNRLLDNAAGVYQLQVDGQARDKFLEKRDGTPELTLIALRKLHNQGIDQVTGKIAQQVAGESLVEAWASARHYIVENHPHAEYLFESLATFYSANVHPLTPLVLAYARQLWREKATLRVLRHTSVLKDTLAYLSNFDIVERQKMIFAPDVVVEKQVAETEALDRLADFLMRYRQLYRQPLFRRLYRDAQIHAWALFDLGGVHLSKGNYSLAKSFYSASIGFYSHFGGFYSIRGFIHSALQDYPAALADFSKAIELDPQKAKAYSDRGGTHSALQDYPAALADFSKTIELNPQGAEAYYKRGATYYSLQDYQAAMADFLKAIELNPQYAEAYYKRGATHHALQDYPAAMADFLKAIELNPQYADAYFTRGATHFALQDYPAALADFSKTIELNPQDARAYSNRGGTHATLQDYPVALADFSKAIELAPQYAEAYYNRGVTYYALQDYPTALADFSKAIELDPQYAEAYLNRGAIHFALQDYPAALADFSKAIELNPQDVRAYSNRGVAYSALQNYPAALADFSKAIELAPQYAEAYYNTARVCALQSQVEQACANLLRAVELDAKFLEAATADRVFDLIRETSEFQAVLKKFKQPLDQLE